VKKLAAALLLVAIARGLPAAEAVGSRGAVATSSRLATLVALEVLQRDGNAIDATVATTFALSVTQPQASPIGGGGALVFYEKKTNSVWVLDMREMSPHKATPEQISAILKDPKRDAKKLAAAAAATPGTVSGLEAAYRRFGTRPWEELLAPAIHLATDGIVVDAQLTDAIASAQTSRHIEQFEETAKLLFSQGKPLTAGSKLVQSDLAATLRRIADRGKADFYDGVTASRILDSLRSAGGFIAPPDFHDYNARWRAPLRIDDGARHIFLPPAPFSGGVFIAESLAMLRSDPIASTDRASVTTMHLLSEVERRAAIDRREYIGDPEFSRIPYKEILSDDHARMWRASIPSDHASTTPALRTELSAQEHTTGFCIADAEGNIVVATFSLGDDFGSGFIADGTGVFMNSAMRDFSLTAPATTEGQHDPDWVAPSKRPRSPLAPAIIFEGEKPLLAVSATGGDGIAPAILHLYLDVVRGRQPLAEAIAAKRFFQSDIPDEIAREEGTFPLPVLQKLNDMGHGVRDMPPRNDVEAIGFANGSIVAVSDPRNGGAAGGF
jgi:gamma-glutamyltranspeptidase/glutathione hydrolase